MSNPKIVWGLEGDGDGLPAEANLSRYSLKQMMAEVRLERTLSALGRELLDSAEIDKLFADRRRRQMNET